MSFFSSQLSKLRIHRMLNSVRKIETGLRAAGLPRFMARLPVHSLGWLYCRMLDQKIVRLNLVAGKFRRWVPMTRNLSTEHETRTALIDLDQSMRQNIEATKSTMWELRSYCIDVGRMFEQLGYMSPALQRRQAAVLSILEESCASASIMQQALAAHDSAALELLRASANASASAGVPAA